MSEASPPAVGKPASAAANFSTYQAVTAPLSADVPDGDISGSVVPVLLAWCFGCAIVRYIAASFVAAPSIFGDELTYWSLARSFHHGMHFVAFNMRYDIPTQIYPIILSPLFSISDSLVTYSLARLLSCVMFCCIVFPAYFMAREFLSRREAMTVAVLSLFIPGGAYTATVLAENLYYPVFIFGVWFCYRTLSRGRRQDAVWTGVIFAAGYFVKPHMLFLMAAYGLALLVWLASEWRTRRTGIQELLPGFVCRCIPLAMFLITLGIRVVEEFKYNKNPAIILSGEAYAGVTQLASYGVPFKAFLVSGTWLLVVMMISTAWLPVVAMVGTAASWKRFDQAERWFYVMSSLTVLVFLVMITRHNVLNDGHLRTHERYIFQLAPLLFTWYFIARKVLPARRMLAATAAVVALTALAMARFANTALTLNSFGDSPTFAGLCWIHIRAPRSGYLICALLLVGGALCIVVARSSGNLRRLLAGWAVFLVACNAGWYVLQITTVQKVNKDARKLAMTLKETMPPKASIGVMPDDTAVTSWWLPEFFLNQPVYYYGVGERKFWFAHLITREPDGTFDFGDERPDFLLAAKTLTLPYEQVGEYPAVGLRMYRVPPLTETKP
jgi:hypothetical protein